MVDAVKRWIGVRKMDKFFKTFLAFAIIVFVAFGGLLAWAITDAVKHNEWLDSLTPEQRQEYEMQQKEKYESKVYKYEVVSVHKYVKQELHGMGRGQIYTEICYNFTYLKNKTLVEVKCYQSKIVIGEKNLYIVDANKNVSYLQLTKETLANMNSLSG